MVARLWTLATDALEAVEAYYAAQGVELPDRRLVSVGQSPWDCELLNVWVVRDFATEGDVAAEVLQSIGAHPGHGMRAASLGVQIARCYPDSPDGMSPPLLEDERVAAELVYQDADLLWRALLAAERSRTLSQPNGLAYEGWAAIGPSGGMAGGVLTVRALL